MPSVIIVENRQYVKHPCPALEGVVMVDAHDTCVHDIDPDRFWIYQYLSSNPVWNITMQMKTSKHLSVDEYLDRFTQYDDKMKKHVYVGDKHIRRGCCLLM